LKLKANGTEEAFLFLIFLYKCWNRPFENPGFNPPTHSLRWTSIMVNTFYYKMNEEEIIIG
jgi:hypothetical protein